MVWGHFSPRVGCLTANPKATFTIPLCSFTLAMAVLYIFGGKKKNNNLQTFLQLDFPTIRRPQPTHHHIQERGNVHHCAYSKKQMESNWNTVTSFSESPQWGKKIKDPQHQGANESCLCFLFFFLGGVSTSSTGARAMILDSLTLNSYT